MQNDLVVLNGKEPVTTSLLIAEGMGIEHRAVLKLIKTYKKDFEELGKSSFALAVQKSGGRPTEYYFLNEENAVFIISLMRNSTKVVLFKKKLASAFVKCRRALSEIFIQRENAEWMERRKNGKIQRKEETDVIMAFIDYATAQGSKNAKMYYCNLTKMENQAIFYLNGKYPNLRDVMDTSQLITVAAADQIVVKALRDGMKEGLQYKEIFRKAKAAVELFASVVGKSPLPKETTLENGQRQIEMF